MICHFSVFGLLNTLGVALKQLACELHATVLLVNLATLWRDGEEEASQATSERGDLKPGFGKLWLSVPSSRLCLSRKEDDLEVTVMKSTHLPGNSTCSLKLSHKGVD